MTSTNNASPLSNLPHFGVLINNGIAGSKPNKNHWSICLHVYNMLFNQHVINARQKVNKSAKSGKHVIPKILWLNALYEFDHIFLSCSPHLILAVVTISTKRQKFEFFFPITRLACVVRQKYFYNKLKIIKLFIKRLYTYNFVQV